jgi:hypothetical protein
MKGFNTKRRYVRRNVLNPPTFEYDALRSARAGPDVFSDVHQVVRQVT